MGGMVDDLLSFYAQAKEATEHFDLFFKKHGLGGLALADHVCYKCGSAKEFDEVRAILEKGAAYMHQATISGRRIAYLKLAAPLPTGLGDVWFVELSDQKPDGSQSSGFDHIEIYPAGEGTYESIVALWKKNDEQVIHVERPHHTTDEVKLPSGLTTRLESGPLIEKIKGEL